MASQEENDHKVWDTAVAIICIAALIATTTLAFVGIINWIVGTAIDVGIIILWGLLSYRVRGWLDWF